MIKFNNFLNNKVVKIFKSSEIEIKISFINSIAWFLCELKSFTIPSKLQAIMHSIAYTLYSEQI